MQTLQRPSAVVAIILLAGCAAGSSPRRSIDIAAPSRASDLSRFELVAQSLEFDRIQNRQTITTGPGGQLETLETWVWHQNRSTVVSIERVVRENRYRIVFEDVDTGGWDFVGPSCQQYLRFVAAIKGAFKPEESRLTFFSDVCEVRPK